jgi:hypothetical protein
MTDRSICSCGHIGADRIQSGTGRYRRTWRHTPNDPGWPWLSDQERPSPEGVVRRFDDTLEWFERTYRPHIKVDAEPDDTSATFDFHTAELSDASRRRLLTFAEALRRMLTDRNSGLSDTARLGGASMLMALHNALLWEEQEAVTAAAVGDWSVVDAFAREKYPDADESSVRGLAELEVMVAAAGFWTVGPRSVTERAKRLPPLDMSRLLWQQLPEAQKSIAERIPGVATTAPRAATGCLVAAFVLAGMLVTGVWLIG